MRRLVRVGEQHPLRRLAQVDEGTIGAQDIGAEDPLGLVLLSGGIAVFVYRLAEVVQKGTPLRIRA